MIKISQNLSFTSNKYLPSKKNDVASFPFNSIALSMCC